MNVSKQELAEIRKLKNEIGALLHGHNGSFLMCAITSVIGDAGVQWRDEQSKHAFIAETVEAISMWYDWYLQNAEKDDE